MGKGSKRRPTNEEAFRNGWEAIFNTKGKSDSSDCGEPTAHHGEGRTTDAGDVRGAGGTQAQGKPATTEAQE